MRNESEPLIQIIVELGPKLHHLIDDPLSLRLRRRLEFALDQFIEQLGLVGKPAVEIHSGQSDRAVRIRVQGSLQPYPPKLMHRVWLASTPVGLHRPDMFELDGEVDFLDHWLTDFVTSLDLATDSVHRVHLFDFLARLALEVIRSRPACLIDSFQAEAYWRSARSTPSSDDGHLPAIDLTRVIKAVLQQGISLTNRAAVRTIILEGIDIGQSTEVLAQVIATHLSNRRVEIHIHPDYSIELLHELLNGPRSVFEGLPPDTLDESPFRLMQDGLFYEMGVRVPDPVWMPSVDLPPGMLAFKINDMLRPPLPGLREDELLVNAEPGELLLLGIQGRPARNPANGNKCAIIPKTSESALGDAQQFTVWRPFEYVVLALAGELQTRMDRFLTLDEVEFELAQFEWYFPEVTRAVLTRFSLAEIAFVLQGLVREGISIRDLRSILERLLQYDVVHVDEITQIVLGDQLVVPEGTSPERIEHGSSYLQFVRNGLKPYISYKFTRGEPTLHVLLVETELEYRLIERSQVSAPDGSEPISKAEEEAIREAVWREVTLYFADGIKPVMLTVSGARAALREILAPEFPDLPVLAYSELRPEMNVTPLATISPSLTNHETLRSAGETASDDSAAPPLTEEMHTPG
jgi:hypothetical protein